MSLQLARQYIETKLAAVAPGGLTIGYDRQAFDIVTPCLILTIPGNTAFQASFGAPGANRVRHTTVVFIEIYTDGGTGSAEALGYADTLMDGFRNANLADGYDCGIPYVQSTRSEEPHTIVNVAIPYVWDTLNG